MLLKHKSPRRIPWIKEQKILALFNYYYAPKQKTFQCDPTSMTLIAGRALKLTRWQLQGIEIPLQEWRTTDNVMVQFTPEEFLAFAEAADAYVEQVYRDSWAEMDSITAED